jgi:hypothetical protein
MGGDAPLDDDRVDGTAPDHKDRPAMRPNPFIRFNRAAEAAGYPALLVEILFAMVIMVAGVALLAMMEAAWAFAWAMLSLVVAIAIISAAMMAALSDDEEPAAERAGARSTPAESEAVVPLPRREPASRQRPAERKAA